MGEYRRISIKMPADLLRKIDQLVELDDFSSRSEAIRVAIRDKVYEKIGKYFGN